MSESHVRQLTLDIRPRRSPTFDDFIVGDNAELLARLKAIAGARNFDAIYLWGPAGCGRSHLLRATAHAALAQRAVTHVAAEGAGDELPLKPGGLLIVDDIQCLSPAAQIALFRAFNTAPLVGLALLLAGDAPPRELRLREDLRTRVGSALVYEVKPLSDDDKAAILSRTAHARGMPLERELIDYLLRRAPRDLGSLMAILDALDAASLERQRAITLPLLRQVLRDADGEPADDAARP